jgi:hypothetical protein
MTSVIFALTGPLAVDRLAQRIHDATNQFRTHRHLEDAARRLDGVALGDVLVAAEHDRADGIALEIQREAERIAGELEHLALHRLGQPVDAADAVGHGDHRALRADLGGGVEVLDAGPDELADLGRIELHENSLCVRRGAVTPSRPVSP